MPSPERPALNLLGQFTGSTHRHHQRRSGGQHAMEHSRKESNTRLFIAQDVAIETLRELCGPVPTSSLARGTGPCPWEPSERGPEVNQSDPTDRIPSLLATGEGASASSTPHTRPSTQHSADPADPADPVIHAAEIRRERRLALQERSIRLRAALALLRLKPFELDDNDDDNEEDAAAADRAPAPAATDGRKSPTPQTSKPTPRNRRPLPPRPHPFAGIAAWNSSSIPDEPVPS